MFSDCNQSQSSSPRLPESRLEKLERLKRVLPDLDLHVDFERLADEIELLLLLGAALNQQKWDAPATQLY